MQVTINIPENLPEAVIQQKVIEFEDELREQARQIVSITNNKKQKYQAIMIFAEKCSSLPTLDHRTSDEILGYEKSELGLWVDE